MSIHLHIVPSHVERSERGEVRWCFGCRKHLAGTYDLHVPDDPMSYYEPHVSYRCDGCGEDRRAGFGRFYTWDEDE
jgi:hypothetical protein